MYSLKEVADKYNITPRTLKYYEEIGLICTGRDKSNYRVYDESAIDRLERILVLRNMGIGTKQIKVMFEKENHEVMEIIAGQKTRLRQEISQLTDMKERISNFLSQTANKTIAAKDLLSRCRSRKSHKIELSSMIEAPSNEERDQIAHMDSLSVQEQELVICCVNKYALSSEEFSLPLKIKITAKTRNEDLWLFFGNYRMVFNWDCDMDEFRFCDQVLGCEFGISDKGRVPCDQYVDIEWILENEKTEVLLDGKRIFELKYTDNSDFSLTSGIGVGTDRGNTVTVKEITVTQSGRKTQVDLAAMRWHHSSHHMDGGRLVIFNTSDRDTLATAESFTLPLKIDLTAKTDDTNIRIYWGRGQIILNWEQDKRKLILRDPHSGKETRLEGGYITPGEYHDISWIIHEDYSALIVNGIVRSYIESATPQMSANVRISSGYGSTLTVDSLTVTELVRG
ncbi:MAG: MerR family transcriptional regulator [Oscillospiraceae bacterium]|nr:MerR family transcriptional regulator [Oscillospiraceae bacterium]